MRIQKRVKAISGNPTEWLRGLVAGEFGAFGRTAAKSMGKFCVGDEITLADVCLEPAVWSAERVRSDFETYPIVRRVF